MDKPKHINGCDEVASSDNSMKADKNDSIIEQPMETSEISNSERTTKKTREGTKIMLALIIPLIISVIALIASIIGNVLQYCSYRDQIRQYEEQQTPELHCRYNYNSIKDILNFTIINVGLVDASSVWANESIYMIIDDQVYEGVDVPHYNYLVYNNSREKMWDIPRDRNQPIELPSFQHRAFDYLMNRFQTEIISKWTISYASVMSQKRYILEAFFVHDLTDRNPKNLINTTGGTLKRDRILDYIASGPVHQIRIFDITKDLELDAPINYRITKDYSIHPLNSWTKLSIEEYNNTVYWSGSGESQVADDAKGTVKYIWRCKNGEWEKWVSVGPRSLVATQPMRMPKTYLNYEDAERVESDPTLLEPSITDPEKRKAVEKEILGKARQKFIKNRVK